MLEKISFEERMRVEELTQEVLSQIKFGIMPIDVSEGITEQQALLLSANLTLCLSGEYNVQRGVDENSKKPYVHISYVPSAYFFPLSPEFLGGQNA